MYARRLSRLGNSGAFANVGTIMKRLMTGVFLAGALLGATVQLGAAPAAACSCKSFSDAAAFARSDAVFVGRVQAYAKPGSVNSSAGPALWTFEVTAVYKGDVSQRQEIVSQVSSSSCGLRIPRRGEFLVFAGAGDSRWPPVPGPGQYYSGLCDGTRAIEEGGLEPGLADSHAPGFVHAAESGPVSPADPGEPSGDAVVIGVAGALVVLVIGATVFVFRRRSSALNG